MRIINTLLSGFITGLGLFFCLGSAGADGPARSHLTILSTTDLHGNIYPVDYNTNKPDVRGLARVASVVKQTRKEEPDLLLLDSGDTIQGTPLTFHHAKVNNKPPDPMMSVMSAIGYDAMAVGNHEYEFGWDVLNKARDEARFPWLSANTYKKGTDQTYFEPFVIKQVSGVRIGILGLTTPGMPNIQRGISPNTNRTLRCLSSPTRDFRAIHMTLRKASTTIWTFRRPSASASRICAFVGSR